MKFQIAISLEKVKSFALKIALKFHSLQTRKVTFTLSFNRTTDDLSRESS